ncbi:hypothetical protein DYB32_004655 [Aphanomyces invadans]|uniref:phosphatidylinositol 3-kinase n=1 Tax=Aphanomyces invadans TaxID=157072 RepID=A0A418AWV0_9STRA|nr:hypothetical protein DYB32_004655 [Aphanomyces invadans]
MISIPGHDQHTMAARRGSFLSTTFSRGSSFTLPPPAPTLCSNPSTSPSSTTGDAAGDSFGLPIPSFHELNPYAHYGTHAPSPLKDNGKPHSVSRWQPVPGLMHSKESLALRQAIGEILTTVHAHVTPATLEIRATTPEYRLESDDWIGHAGTSSTGDKNTVKAVARLPMELLEVEESSASSESAPACSVSGWLKKRGETNKAMKRRYMELEDRALCYYKRKPEKQGTALPVDQKAAVMKGKIDLDSVSSIQPTVIKGTSVTWGIDLVTTNRTWTLQAESEADFHMWVKCLCHSVPFHSVNVVFRRMLQLAEVSASGPNEVRMVLFPFHTVKDTVDHVFQCYQNMLDATPLRQYDPREYVLKFTGFRDFMLDPNQPLGKYQHVAECFLKRKTLCLTLVHKSYIDDALRQSQVGAPLFPATEFLNSVHPAHGTSMAITTLGADWKCPRPAMASPSSPRSANNTTGASRGTVVVASGQVAVVAAVRMHVHRVVNIPRFTCALKRSAHDAGTVERRPLTCQNVVVRVELYDGGQLLEVVGETSEVPLCAMPAGTDAMFAQWGRISTESQNAAGPVWLESQLRLCDAPRSTRVVLSLCGGGGSKQQDGVILTTGYNLFDVDCVYSQGEQYIQLWDNLHHARHGPVPHVVVPERPFVHLELQSNDAAIVFDWHAQLQLPPSPPRPVVVQTAFTEPTSSVPSPPRPTRVTRRADSVTKEGWLKKTGKFHSLTNWQPRWCVLSQGNGALYYGDGPATRHKGAIHLAQGATVTAADELNETYTTFAVSKGTRKEHRTWVFKVKSNESSREYVLCAATRQERDEWMLAIKVVANGTNMESVADLRQLLLRDPLFQLSEYQQSLLWRQRMLFVDSFEALRHVLGCVNWHNAAEVADMLALLPQWAKPQHPAAYLSLLDMQFSHEGVRLFAVQKLSAMADSTFRCFLPQLVQALKYENHHVSHLAKLLIQRAIENPNQIGFDLFWAMKVESYNDQFKERYGLLLNAYVDVCSRKMRGILELQDKLFSEKGEFEQICQHVKTLAHAGTPKDEMVAALRERLTALNATLPTSYQLPLDPRVEVGKIVVQKCKIMSSAKLPLWLEFENAEEGGDPVVIIFKAGDDVRQDCLTLQLIALMDEMWREEGKDLAMEPYKCVSTGPMTGMLQVVLHAVTTAAVHRRGGALGGIFGAFNDVSFSDWIAANNGDPRSYRMAVDLFLRSCAGYCVATYVLGIGDRHNDNIMITKQGRYFHIDFGHFLGFMKYQREQTPFVFTPEMAYVFGGVGTDDFKRFQRTCGDAFNVVRRNLHLLVSLLLLMIPADMPELRTRHDISYIVEVSVMERTDEDASAGFAALIVECMNNTFKRIDNTLHIIKHR